MTGRRRILVAGASGATGRRLVIQLLAWGHEVRAIVRSSDRLPADLRRHGNLTLIEGSPLGLDDDALVEAVRGCDAVSSCLGHNVSLRGIAGPPYRLVTRSVARLCDAVRAAGPAQPVRFVLMGSVGVRNVDLDERRSGGERLAFSLIRALVPPHADNERAAEYLRCEIGTGDGVIEWVVVRPDSLQEGIEVSGYAVYPSPTRSALFDSGHARRSNVAHFMARLATREEAWRQWRYRMPVLYNQASEFEPHREERS